MCNDIKGKNENYNKKFLTNFFWNTSNNGYAIAENIGKVFLRLCSYQNFNTNIEIISLSLEEKINFINNLNYVVMTNNELEKMFNIKNEDFLTKIIELSKNETIIENIKNIYCADWIDPTDMVNVINESSFFIERLLLKKTLNLNLSHKKHNNRIKI